MKKRNCLLSVAMIVKDEEHNIRRALESIKDIVDEIVVVDTGSKDRTPEIVREYTDKLYFHEWRNDFSEARNYSLKFPACEWIMILDADEEASEEFRENIREFLSKLSIKVNTVYVPTLSYLNWDFTRFEVASTARIFRNGTVYYKNIVHNQPIYKPEVVDCPYKIIHYGYIWTRKLKRKKYDRTRNLIIEHLKNPESPLDELYYLMQLYKTESIGGKPYLKYEVAFDVYRKLINYKKIPPIGLEFLFLFGTDCAVMEFYDLAEKLLKLAIDVMPQYPDPYFGMMALFERKKEWEKVLDYGNKYLKRLEEAMKKLKEFKLTLMTLKERAIAYLLMAKASIELGRIEEFNVFIEGFLKHIADINASKFSSLITSLRKLKKSELKKIVSSIVKVARFYSEKNYSFHWDEFIEIFLSNGVYDEDMINYFSVKDSFYEKALRHFLDSKRDYFLEVLFGDDPIEKVLNRKRVGEILFLFDYFNNDINEVLMFLNKARKVEDDTIKGVALALMGDTYLKQEKIKEALNFYKKAMNTLPEISKFIKPVIEDLKMRIDTDIEGSFEELYKYYLGKKELLIDVKSLIPKKKAELLYLVSSHPTAYYISAILTEDKKKARELLENIPKEIRFKYPFYYYRFAKTYEDSDKKKAFEYHVKACQENENIGDIKYGLHKYNGFYPHEIPDFYKDEDEIVWVGNLTETFSTFGAINPVKMWKKSKKDFYYSYPFALFETIKKYYRREEKILKGLKPFRIDRYKLIEALADIEIGSIRIFDFSDLELEDDFSYLKSELDIEINENPKALFIPYGAEIYKEEDILKYIKGSDKAIIIFRVPNFEDRNDPMWSYPPFRFIRPYSYWKKVLKKNGYIAKTLKVIDKNTRLIMAEKLK